MLKRLDATNNRVYPYSPRLALYVSETKTQTKTFSLRISEHWECSDGYKISIIPAVVVEAHVSQGAGG